jgi:autotransporter-associated beta strand protein
MAGDATIQSSGQYGNNVLAGGAANQASVVFSSTADLSFSGAGTRVLSLGGNSIGDNTMRIRLRDNPNAGETLSLLKVDGGLWILNPATSNSYTGATTVSGGQLRAVDGVGIPSESNITLSGGVYEVPGASFTRTLGTGAGQVQWTNGGFAAGSPSRLMLL